MDTPQTPSALAPAPDRDEQELMELLDITYEDGVYRFGELHYVRLADAVNFARLRRLQGPR